MNKGRITYRFDSAGQRTVEDDTTSKEQQQQQLVPIKEEEPSDLQEEESTVAYEINKFTSDFGSWESPFDTETEKLERLIRHPKQTPIEVSVATPVHEPPVSEHEQEVTYSSIWEEESVPSRTGGTLRYIRKSSKTWMKMFTSFTGAVVTGLILGIIVLTFFSNEELADPSSTDQPSNQSSDMPPKDVAETDLNADAGTSTDGPSPLPVQVPAGSFVLLQNGVFTTLEAAEAAVTALRSQGFAAVMLEEEQYYVFAAVLTNRDDALALSQELQKSDFETFIKTIDLQAVRELDWGVNDAAQIESYFTQANDIAQMLIDFSAIHLQNGASSPLEQSSIEALQNIHQSWSMVAHDLVAEVKDDIKPVVEQMNHQLNTAVLAMEEYHKSPAASHQWEVQHAIMQYLFLYEDLRPQQNTDLSLTQA